MKSLRPPYKTILGPDFDDKASDRMWRRIEARHRRPGASSHGGSVGVALGAIAGAIVVLAIAHVTQPPARMLVGTHTVLATTAVPSPAPTERTSARRYSSRGEPQRIDLGIAVLTFHDADVAVDRSDDHVSIRVERGEVDVRGANVRGGSAHLSAGMLLEIDAETSLPAAPRTAAAVVPPPSWRALAARGANPEAYAALGDGGVGAAARAASVDDLLALADVARLSGHPREAVAPLHRVIDEDASDPRASLAALTLGRVELDELDEPAAAARALERAIALGPPKALEEDAYVRLVEAHARAGDDAAAQLAYDHAVARFPGSPREPTMRRWIERH